MKFWKDKEGKELTFKEFMSRWKSGINEVSQLQQIKIQINSTFITLIGILAGIVISIIGFKNLWWLGIILIGALGNTGVQLLGLYQKKFLFEGLEKLEGGLENE